MRMAGAQGRPLFESPLRLASSPKKKRTQAAPGRAAKAQQAMASRWKSPILARGGSCGRLLAIASDCWWLLAIGSLCVGAGASMAQWRSNQGLSGAVRRSLRLSWVTSRASSDGTISTEHLQRH